MGFLAITPSVNGTTGEVTYASAVPANGVSVTGIVLREFMTNGPTKNANGTYNTTIGDLVYDVKVRPNSVTATITVTSEIGRAHVRTPVTEKSRMPSSA